MPAVLQGYELEPGVPAEVLQNLSEYMLAVKIYYGALENATSEQSSRMNNGERLEERRRDDREADDPVQPRAPGQDHHRAHRDHFRRRVAQRLMRGRGMPAAAAAARDRAAPTLSTR